ncbi:MAG: AbrB/MazE/SpoVT family DNA-binding domain-containing protein [Peptococcaceae bacterium]|nr:MAG: AbrB/MazE/SpoVT family DNA-binding domain-containing protein [Peptococcaceae bacterium]
MAVVRLSSKGQLVLPKDIRERLALKQGLELNVELRGEKIILEPLRQETRTDWRRWRSSLKGKRVLEEHLEEHRQEVNHDDQDI